MMSLGPDEMAKYPFLADAGQYLRDKGFTLEQFGTDPDLRVIVDKACHRIEAAAAGGVYKSDIVEGAASSGAALPREAFSFLIAVVLLRLAGARTLVRRFALAEARRAEGHLARDLAAAPGGEGLAPRIMAELFSVRVERDGADLAVPVADYVRRSVAFHEREWKLVNRRVWGGLVRLTPRETVRLVRAEIGSYIVSRIDAARVPEMSPGFAGPVGRLAELAKRFEVKRAAPTAVPPCVKHAIGVLERGENLPHSGRFMLGTFLLARGEPVERIAPLFRNAPDYSERVTMYQLRSLAGGGEGGRGYSCPSCEKLRGQGLCFATAECDGIRSPVQFGARRAPDA